MLEMSPMWMGDFWILIFLMAAPWLYLLVANADSIRCGNDYER